MYNVVYAFSLTAYTLYGYMRLALPRIAYDMRFWLNCKHKQIHQNARARNHTHTATRNGTHTHTLKTPHTHGVIGVVGVVTRALVARGERDLGACGGRRGGARAHGYIQNVCRT